MVVLTAPLSSSLSPGDPRPPGVKIACARRALRRGGCDSRRDPQGLWRLPLAIAVLLRSVVPGVMRAAHLARRCGIAFVGIGVVNVALKFWPDQYDAVPRACVATSPRLSSQS